jgi:hypothetical protein
VATTRTHSREPASDASEGLVALVRLLARQAAREAMASIESANDPSASIETPQPNQRKEAP